MKKNVFGLLGLLGALIFASCTNPMIASGSSGDETAPTPVVRIAAAPVSYEVGESSTLIAKVSNTGKGKVSYQWYTITKNTADNGEETSESPIEGVENVYVSNERTAGDYVYFVRVSNVLGNSIKTVDSDPVTITVKAKEEAKASAPFLVLSVDKTVYAKNVTFKLFATAESKDGGKLSYQWYRKAAGAADFAAISGATSSTYETSEENAGTYTYKIEVTNTLNNTTAEKSESIEISIVDVEKVDAQTPVFETVLISSSYDVSDTENASALSAKAKVTDGGLITYKWYLIEGEGENEKETEIASGESYVPAINVVGKFTYKLVATNNNAGATGATTAKAELSVVITVVDPSKKNAKDPVITAQPESKEYTQYDKTIAPLTVTASSEDGGEVTYQWYKDDKKIEGATEASYTPAVDEAGTYSYYVVVTNTIPDGENVGIKSVSVSSSKVEVKVNPYKIAAPVFTTQPVLTKTTELNSTELLLISAKAVSAEGEPTYQWYKLDGENEIALTGQTGMVLLLSSETEGTFKYFCRATITVTKNEKPFSATADSEICTFTVTNPEVIVDAVAPVITGTIADVEYEKDTTATAIDATASVTDGGTITYHWFKLTDDGWTSVTEDTATNANFTPATTTEEETTYKVVVKNTNNSVNGNKEATTEKQVKVTVKAKAVAKSPVISAQPVSAGYVLNATVTALSVTAASPDNGTLTYQWYKGSVAITGATEASYTPTAAEAGVSEYKVVVTNTISNGSSAEITSSIAVITVTDPDKRNAKVPSFTTDLSEETVEYTVSSTAAASALTVAATSEDSDGTITYEWYKNGVKISGVAETAASYTPAITEAGTFTYQVIAKNTIPEADDVGIRTATKTSKVVTIVVNPVSVVNAKAPKITTDLTAAASYVQGDTVTLSVTAESQDGGTLSYQWYKGEAKVGTDSNSLVFDTKDWAEDGKTSVSAEYHVIVKNTIADNNDGGKKSEIKSSATVTVKVTTFMINVPVVTVSTDKANYKLGDKVVLTAEATGLTEGSTLAYRWTKGEEVIASTTTNTYEYTPETAGNYEFYCTVTARKSNGNYTDSEAGISPNAPATVSDWEANEPSITTQPKAANYNIGATNVAALSVSASANDGALSYQWYSAPNATVAGAEITGATSESYTPSAETAGNVYYYVVVKNTVTNGTVTREKTKESSHVLISVNSQYKYAATPVFLNSLVSANYTQGDEVTALDAFATASSVGNAIGGTPTYQWYKANSETGDGEAISGATNSTYTPSIAAVGTLYYYCVATNTVPANTEGLDPDTSKHSATAKSTVAKIVVKALIAKKPIASITANKTEYTVGDDSQVVLTAIKSYASTDEGTEGTITYQWYEVDGENHTEIEDATDAQYIVPKNVSAGTHKYTVKIKNTVSTGTAETSEAATASEITIIAGTGTGGITIDFN